MGRQARVTDLEVLRLLRSAMLTFEHDARESLEALRLEAQRGVGWLEQMSRYWPAEVRRASDELQSARIALERCEMELRPEDRRSCYDEKRAVERARQRLRLCEEKVKLVRKWALEVGQQADDFRGDLGRLEHYLDSDVPRAATGLARMLDALAKYASGSGELEGGTSGSGGAGGSGGGKES